MKTHRAESSGRSQVIQPPRLQPPFRILCDLSSDEFGGHPARAANLVRSVPKLANTIVRILMQCCQSPAGRRASKRRYRREISNRLDVPLECSFERADQNDSA